MPKSDTGNYNRFLTSLGLLFLAAALLVPYFYFRDTEVLRISQHELLGLTDTARAAIENRQDRAADLEIVILVAAGVLGALGLGALVFGGRRLRTAQASEDKEIERRAKREDFELQQLSSEEVDEKRDEQAREVMSEGDSDDQPEAPKSASTAPTPAAPQHPPTRSQPSYRESRDAVARIEEKVKMVLKEGQIGPYEFAADLKIVGNDGQQLRLDGLFTPGLDSGQPVVLELRLAPRRFPVPTRMMLDSTLSQLVRFNAITGRSAVCWLLLAMPEGAEQVPDEEIERAERRLTSGMVGLGRATFVDEANLSQIPQLFVQRFAS